MIALQDIVIVYDWPGENHVSFALGEAKQERYVRRRRA